MKNFESLGASAVADTGSLGLAYSRLELWLKLHVIAWAPEQLGALFAGMPRRPQPLLSKSRGPSLWICLVS